MRPKSKKLHSLAAHFLTIVSVAVFLFPSLAETLELGPNISYAKFPSVSLTQPMVLRPSFFRRVGGVAFASVAEGHQGLSALAVSYDAQEVDGRRLKVTLADKDGTTRQVVGNLYDWQLVPIARFAATDHHSAVTLFGQLKNKEEEERQKNSGNMIVSYHPAFEDTLLGLRLLQGDMLIINPHAADLFKEKGSYILGSGEKFTSGDVQRNQENFDMVQEWIKEQSLKGKLFQSYVVSDIGRKVKFSFMDNRLVLSGEPVWFSWRNSQNYNDKVKDIISQQSRKQDEAIGKKVPADVAIYIYSIQLEDKIDPYRQQIREVLKAAKGTPEGSKEGKAYEAAISGLSDKIDQGIVEFVEKVKTRLSTQPSSQRPRLLEQKDIDSMTSHNTPEARWELMQRIFVRINSLDKDDEIRRRANDIMKKQVKLVRSAAEQLPVDRMEEYSGELTAQIRKGDGVNRVVYDALVTTMRYAALFRHVRANNPDEYAQFLDSLNDVSIGPRQPVNYDIQTPTVYPKGRG